MLRKSALFLIVVMSLSAGCAKREVPVPETTNAGQVKENTVPITGTVVAKSTYCTIYFAQTPGNMPNLYWAEGVGAGCSLIAR